MDQGLGLFHAVRRIPAKVRGPPDGIDDVIAGKVERFRHVRRRCHSGGLPVEFFGHVVDAARDIGDANAKPPRILGEVLYEFPQTGFVRFRLIVVHRTPPFESFFA